MEQVDFSNPVWVDVTGLIVRKSVAARELGGLAGKSVTVVAGTPNQKALEDSLKKGLVKRQGRPGEDLRRGHRPARRREGRRARGGKGDAGRDRDQDEGALETTTC